MPPPPEKPNRHPPYPVDPFANEVPNTGQGGAAFAGFLELFRTLQDAVTRSRPPEDNWNEAAEYLKAAIDLLQPWPVPEWHQPAGTRLDLPGRGSPLLVPFVAEAETRDSVQGQVEFRPFHIGGNNAAHGGTIALLFDEVLGRLANSRHRTVARTAYLTVNFRQVVPIDVSLRFEGSVDRQEGRKRFVTGRLYDGETLLADGEALFVELRPGQP